MGREKANPFGIPPREKGAMRREYAHLAAWRPATGVNASAGGTMPIIRGALKARSVPCKKNWATEGAARRNRQASGSSGERATAAISQDSGSDDRSKRPFETPEGTMSRRTTVLWSLNRDTHGTEKDYVDDRSSSITQNAFDFSHISEKI
jgi:hypothetical protein